MSITQPYGYRHIQETASATWVIVHRGNTMTPIVDVWFDNNGSKEKVMPSDVVVDSNIQVTIHFTQPYAGEALVQ